MNFYLEKRKRLVIQTLRFVFFIFKFQFYYAFYSPDSDIDTS